jgi:hypothetical protein
MISADSFISAQSDQTSQAPPSHSGNSIALSQVSSIYQTASLVVTAVLDTDDIVKPNMPNKYLDKWSDDESQSVPLEQHMDCAQPQIQPLTAENLNILATQTATENCATFAPVHDVEDQDCESSISSSSPSVLGAASHPSRKCYDVLIQAFPLGVIGLGSEAIGENTQPAPTIISERKHHFPACKRLLQSLASGHIIGNWQSSD